MVIIRVRLDLPMQASMLEVYNEEIKDLLGKGPPAGMLTNWSSLSSLLSLLITTELQEA